MANLNDAEVLKIVAEAKVIVVVGMVDENKSHRAAYQIPEQLQKRGYVVIPVNPKIASSLGEKAFATLAQVPLKADILDVFRNADAIPALAEEILAMPVEKRPGCVWLQSGITHSQAEQKLEEAGLKVVSDRCLGVVAAQIRKI